MAGTTGSPTAAIDCGTNSTRLLVVDGTGVALARLMRITRLGQGVDAAHKLDVAAVDRTLEVLREFRRVMDGFGVTRSRLVATSAVRDAVNGEEFLAAATEVVGSPAELLSGPEEGRLAYEGATADLPDGPGTEVVVDIGGGSTELVAAPGGRVRAVSMDVGCVRLTERYLGHDPPYAGEMARAVAAVDAELDHGLSTVLGPVPAGAGRLVGLAGTVSTLATLEQGLGDYDRERIHHFELRRSAVDRWIRLLAGEPAAARARRPGMAPGREDVIVGGALVLRQVMYRLSADYCLVSEDDILDGLVRSLRT